MKKHNLRKDKTCLNCGSFVAEKYCSKCGQENRDSRESFFHLITEFIADFVHYDSSFWKTTRNLLFSPAKLSLVYMDGKRKSYVNPVKLYIFISFITFFLPAILPSDSSSALKKDLRPGIDGNLPKDWKLNVEKYGKVVSVEQLDSIHESKPKKEQITEIEYKTYRNVLLQKKESQSQPNHEIVNSFKLDSITKYGKITTLAQLDSIHESKPKEERISKKEYKAIKKYLSGSSFEKKPESVSIQASDFLFQVLNGAFQNIEYAEIEKYGKIKSSVHLESVHNTKAPHEKLTFIKYMSYKSAFNIKDNMQDMHKNEKMIEFVIHNLSKVLFVYMPIFAFWMWIFNLNRRKYYFDSGIFTLHFFSFWLLLISILMTINSIFTIWLNSIDWIFYLIVLFSIFYITFYFFRGNRLFYGDKRFIANIKGVFLMLINTVFILIVFVIFLIIAAARSY